MMCVTSRSPGYDVCVANRSPSYDVCDKQVSWL